MVATRASSRITRDGVPIATKAEKRVMAKNYIPGNKTTSDPTNNPFTILNNASTSSLHEVMIDLDLAVDNIEDQLDAFRVEERARAAIAEANYKSYLDRQKERTQPQDESQLADLDMGVISNKERDFTMISSKGGVGDSNPLEPGGFDLDLVYQ